ncbi:hypothetical protein QWM81_04225 [Streptomyces ficellus]|uniref:Uncharacterized protein n=1 Tax=Streptomyces ficellus TaxID=1977088 RepID=A0ABT7Z1A2_9ACTN|nr:hypothetical protein [Streptomyces ficellus]MDN3293268.1 hypothetical protein [Streptomyces ficellus]
MSAPSRLSAASLPALCPGRTRYAGRDTTAFGFLAAAPAAAHDPGVEGCWVSGGHVQTGKVHVNHIEGGCFDVG